MIATPAPQPWVVCPRPSGTARLRLFCFPYAGAGPSIFRAWPDDLPREVEICAIQLPGREGRFKEPPFRRLTPLVQALFTGIAPWLTMPFALDTPLSSVKLSDHRYERPRAWRHSSRASGRNGESAEGVHR